ncbi:MAG TPA: YdeI/OmpD-associated family protein [Lunatimonas sp.]|nr:YdeI/OmpD-associated family protein [Lunatimonas sp.]
MDSKKNPLVNNKYLLEKFPGKGGWTYVLLPEIPPAKRFPFGWMRVYGSIDEFKLEKYKLMPFGKGMLFLPVKASLRKQLKKEAGDWVSVVLYEEEHNEGIPEVILECLKDAPGALHHFQQLPAWEQRLHIDRIMDAKNQEKQIALIVGLIDRLEHSK